MKAKIQTALGDVNRVEQNRLPLFYAQLWLLLLALLMPTLSHAVETVCARVKIEIKQELTLERQAFDAQMKINNTTADGVISNVSIAVMAVWRIRAMTVWRNRNP